jgi:hypothetical protein
MRRCTVHICIIILLYLSMRISLILFFFFFLPFPTGDDMAKIHWLLANRSSLRSPSSNPQTSKPSKNCPILSNSGTKLSNKEICSRERGRQSDLFGGSSSVVWCGESFSDQFAVCGDWSLTHTFILANGGIGFVPERQLVLRIVGKTGFCLELQVWQGRYCQ